MANNKGEGVTLYFPKGMKEALIDAASGQDISMSAFAAKAIGSAIKKAVIAAELKASKGRK